MYVKIIIKENRKTTAQRNAELLFFVSIVLKVNIQGLGVRINCEKNKLN